jgi:hypothetical protein
MEIPNTSVIKDDTPLNRYIYQPIDLEAFGPMPCASISEIIKRKDTKLLSWPRSTAMQTAFWSGWGNPMEPSMQELGAFADLPTQPGSMVYDITKVQFQDL